MERAWKPNVEISPNCPRCGSSNTKFCYYNNYSLTQPRYFCKGCRRYWTKGGSLRNVPVGGGCRKNRRLNRTLRQPNIGSVPHKTLHYGESATNSSNICHSYDPRNSSSSSSSAVSDGPNIDLALVYANFVNPNPDSRSVEKKPEMPSTDFDSSVEVGPSMIPNLPEDLGFSTGFLNLPEQSTEVSQFSEGNQMYFGGFNSMQNDLQEDGKEQQCNRNDIVNNFELPPLPGEEAASVHDMIWSSSDMLVNNDNLQNTQLPVFGAEVDDQEDLLMANWSPFDLPRGASFSRP